MGFKNFERFITEGEALHAEAEFLFEQREFQVSVAVLLMSVYESSGMEEKPEAVAQMSKGLQKVCAIDETDIGDTLEIAEVIASSETHRDTLLQKLREHCSTDQRIELYSTCCQVVIADGVLEETELSTLNSIATLLELSLEQQTLARKLAERDDSLLDD